MNLVWTIEFDEAALKHLRKLGRPEATRIRNDLRDRIAILDNPRETGKALQGSTLGDFWRYRVGDYRIICELQDHRVIVMVVAIGHRREIYT